MKDIKPEPKNPTIEEQVETMEKIIELVHKIFPETNLSENQKTNENDE